MVPGQPVLLVRTILHSSSQFLHSESGLRRELVHHAEAGLERVEARVARGRAFSARSGRTQGEAEESSFLQMLAAAQSEETKVEALLCTVLLSVDIQQPQSA
jgi:hypothetical protein